MSTTLSARFEIASWDEQPYLEGANGLRLTRASVTRTYTGELQGEGAVEYLMAYAGETSATFVGLERIEGTLDGRAGSVVLQHVGTFDGQTARGTVAVVEGTGTDGLEGLAGEGEFAAERGPVGTISLEYRLGR